MKQLKKLKNVHKQLLGVNDYNAKEYLYERDTTEEIVFINLVTKDKLVFMKNEGVFKC